MRVAQGVQLPHADEGVGSADEYVVVNGDVAIPRRKLQRVVLEGLEGVFPIDCRQCHDVVGDLAVITELACLYAFGTDAQHSAETREQKEKQG